MSFSFLERVTIAPNVLVRFLEGESVLLNVETERYFGLDETGTRMWQLLTASPNIEAAYEKLADEFEVQPETLRRHLVELIERLTENGLVELLPADVGTASAV